MKNSITVNWKDNMSFTSEINGHKIVVDAIPEVGGNDEGPRPKPLLMLSLAGCSGMDVVSILKKMKVEIEDFKMHVESELTEEHPKVYSSMHLVYEFKGKDLDENKLKRAVELSQDKYCGVSAMLRKATELSYEIKIVD